MSGGRDETDPPTAGAHSHAALDAARRAATATDAQTFWEPHYAALPATSDEAVPQPNPVLVDLASTLPPGTALDLGCGQGGDALWLARHGWHVTTVDVSGTALHRVAEHASRAGLSERVRTERHDLTATFPTGGFDLVSAQHLHSPVAMDRAAVLAHAAGAVRPGGMLLVVDHASVTPWSWADPDTVLPTPQQALDAIGLDPAWHVDVCQDREREAKGPDGQRALVTDTVLALVRLPRRPG